MYPNSLAQAYTHFKMKNFVGSEQTTEENFHGIQTQSQIIDSTEENRARVDCEVTNWSEWTDCNNCQDYMYSVREITVIIHTCSCLFTNLVIMEQHTRLFKKF